MSRDEHGTVHVRTERPDDLDGAIWAMGYAHAMDRGLQICIMRILGEGRASECLDSSDAMLEVDRFFRRMDWRGRTAPELAKLDERSRRLLDSYCEGVNARLLAKRPWELALVGYRPEPWTPANVIMLSRMIGYLTLAQSQAEIERLFVEMVQAGVDDARLLELFPCAASSGWCRADIEKVTLGDRIVPDGARWGCALPRMMASNNWVIAPGRSATGSAILANDPHLETNRLPNVWYLMALDLGGRGWAVGAGMPGVPGILVGRNRDLSWGATYTFMDSVDSWIERCRDGRHDRAGEWVGFASRTEVIRRKGKPDAVAVFHENGHGVLDGDPSKEGYYLATRWAPGDGGGRSVTSMIGLLSAGSVAEGMDLLGRLEVSFSWVLADTGGHIGFQMSGLMPRRRNGNGFAPLPGWDPENDWDGFVDPADLPRCMDPEEGFFVTANQDLNSHGVAKPIDMPMGDYRARRIAERLSAMDKVRVEDIQAIHSDTYSLQAAAFLEILKPLLPDGEAGRLLAGWDCRYDPGSRAASIFEDFYSEMRSEVFGKDGLGNEVVDHLASETGIFVDFYANLDAVLLAGDSAWLAGRSRDDVWRAAFGRAAGKPATTWGERNRITLANIFFGGKLPGFLGFDRGPFPLQGGRATPHQGQIYRSAGRVTSFAPSLRLIADMGADHVLASLAGGPADRRFSRWYASGIEGWRAGRYDRLER